MKNHPKARISDHIGLDVPTQSEKESSTSPTPVETPSSSQPESEELQDEMSRIRALLRPPPIPGVEQWGIPTEPSTPPDPALVTKLAQFQALKRDPTHPKHFNDSLMSNRSFRNPHLYAKLVEFAEVDERATNFPREIWDPYNVKPEWYADQIAELQKVRAEQQAATQPEGKRCYINFTPSNKSRVKEKEQETGSATGRRSRFQSYAFDSKSGGRAAYS